MKSVDLRYKRVVSQIALVTVEVPDDFSEEDAAKLLTSEQIEIATAEQWDCLGVSIEEQAVFEEGFTMDDDNKGAPQYRLNESGVFVEA